MPEALRYEQIYNPYTRFVIDEYFQKIPGVVADTAWQSGATFAITNALLAETANANYAIAGTAAVDSCAVFSATGGITLTTTTSSNDQVLLIPNTTTNETNLLTTGQWLPSTSPRYEAMISSGASIANVTIFAGLKLTNTPAVATDNDQIYFRFSTADTEATYWQLIYSKANSDTTVALNPANPQYFVNGGNTTLASGYTTNPFKMQASCLYKLVINIDAAAGVVTASINDTIALTIPYTSLTASAAFLPFQGIQTLTTAAKSMGVKRIVMSKPYAA